MEVGVEKVISVVMLVVLVKTKRGGEAMSRCSLLSLMLFVLDGGGGGG